MKYYLTKLKEKFFIRVYLLIIFILLAFSLGLVASLKQVGERSWVPAAIDKAKIVLGLTKLKEFKSGLSISTSRYEFETTFKTSKKGQYQITTTNGTNIIALERNTGLLLSLTPDETGYKETVLSQSVFPKDIEQKKAPSSYPPLVMDVHFGLNRLLYSLVVKDKDKSDCQSLVLYEVTLGNPMDKSFGVPTERFRTTPCVFDTGNTVMWAGRIVNNENTIFLSVGEERFDRSGYPKTDIFKPEELIRSKTVFGKILAFNPATYEYSVYSMGHRNAQGLFWDKERYQLLESEHGPLGGDEVNIITKGGDYGWPNVSFGKPYPSLYPSGRPELNDSKNPGTGVDLKPERKSLLSGRHDGYIPPIMSWTLKAGGVGQILRVPQTSPLKDWQGDILVAIMGEASLHRLKLYRGVVIMDENINVGVRIRDMILLNNGNLAISLDEGTLFILKTTAL